MLFRPLSIALFSLTCSAAQAEPLADSLRRIENDYRQELTDCGARLAICQKAAASRRKAAILQVWQQHAPPTFARHYPGDLTRSKALIGRDFRRDQAFCQQLPPHEAAACQRELLRQKKLALKAVQRPTDATVSAVRSADANQPQAELQLRLDSGETRTLPLPDNPYGLRPGDRVRLQDLR